MINLGNLEISKMFLGQTEVTSMYLGDTQVYGGTVPVPNEPYVTMILAPGVTEAKIGIIKEGYSTPNIQYRLNNGDWTKWDYDKSTPIVIGKRDILQFKGKNTSGFSGNNGYVRFDINNDVNLYGNIMSLIDEVGKTKTIPYKYCFQYLFYNTKIKNVSKNFLPATTLKDSCYYKLFSNCTSLISAPELKATNMYYGCYNSMFEGCSSLTTAPKLPSTTLHFYCYSHMFSGCSSLTKAPTLPATETENNCYDSMFSGCTSLTQAPELPAITLASECYSHMFYNCKNLSKIKCLGKNSGVNVDIKKCTNNWLYNVASSGTFIKSANTTFWTTGDSGIPSGWTVEEV